MKIIILLAVLFNINYSALAQKVSNIRAEQRGQDIVVLYSLETNSPCEVSLLLSQDNGVTWGSPLKNVSGDVGKSITAGEKQINWKVLEEREQLVGDNLKFKVIANRINLLEPEMVFVEGGVFEMGSNFGAQDEKPLHMVRVNSFKIGKYEVTQAQWRSVMEKNPSVFVGCDNCPVENVSWKDAQEYINALNLLSGKKYRLPTEAEWEYAARGGNVSKGYTYSGSNDLNAVSWNVVNSDGKTHPVGLKKANELGIYDMTGNVLEWCSDWYGLYSHIFLCDPMGAYLGEYRVQRGGSWNWHAYIIRITFRGKRYSEQRSSDFGFRLALPI